MKNLMDTFKIKKSQVIHSKEAQSPKDGPLAYFVSTSKKLSASKKKEASPNKKDIEIKTDPTEKIIHDLIVKHPEMNASTFLNLLKSKGISFAQDKSKAGIPPGESKEEADSASSNPAMLRDDKMSEPGTGKHGPKWDSCVNKVGAKGNVDNPYAVCTTSVGQQNSKKESRVGQTISLRFVEMDHKPADPQVGFTKFKCILIQEGMGNMKDAFYYSKDALKSAVSVFEGKKIYADHPSEVDEISRPERSVRDVLGHFESVKYEEANGRGFLSAEVIIPPDEPYLWARSLMGHAVEYSKKYPDKDFIGLSINATGDATETPIDEVIKQAPEDCIQKLNEAKEKGIESIRLVSVIADAVSTDLVTEAGAGGRVLDMLEGNKENQKENEMGFPNKDEKDPKAAAAAPAKDGEPAQEKKEGEDSSAENPEHDDEAQDIELIKSMLKKYLGDDDEASEEECNMAKEAKESYGEMGYSEEESEKAAVHALKLARHMAAKQSKESEEGEENEESEVEESEKKEAGDQPDPSKLKAESEKQIESLRKENIALKGKLASFTEAERKGTIAAHLEKKMEAEKLPAHIRKELREANKSARSKEQVDENLKIYLTGYKAGGKKVFVTESNDWSSIISTERTTEPVGKKSGISFEGITNE